MAQDRLALNIRLQMQAAYRQSSLWLGHFYVLITIWRLLFHHQASRMPLILEAMTAGAAFYGIALFTRPLARLVGELENLALVMFAVILANNVILVWAFRDASGVTQFALTMVMAGAALRTLSRFLLVEALTLAAWIGSCQLWLREPLLDVCNPLVVCSGLLLGGILFRFIRGLVDALSKFRDKDHQLLLQRATLIRELREALEGVKTLRGIIPICSYCRKIRNDEGYWNQVETYLESHSDARFSHGICPDCMAPLQAEIEAVKEGDQGLFKA
jgi:hypothetical protein